MRIRRIDYIAGEFTYANRIAMTKILQQEELSEYQRIKMCWIELYGWTPRFMPPRRRAKEFELFTAGLKHWVDLEQEKLKYEPTAEELRAGIKSYSEAVGDMATIKALAKAYHIDPDDVLRWEWGKVFGILSTDLEEFKFSERLRKEYENKH